MTRSWTEARKKCEGEPCRVCGGIAHDPAHVIPRSRIPGPEAMHAANIVPLCRGDHKAFDQGRLDLLPYLTREEQTHAASLVGLAEAYQRTTNTRSAA